MLGVGGGDATLLGTMWEGVITAGMSDQLNFIGSGERRSSDAVMALFAHQANELLPSLQASPRAGLPSSARLH